MWYQSTSAMHSSGMRKYHRTGDEISIDNANHGGMDEVPLSKVYPEENLAEDESDHFILEDSRIELIKDVKTKEKFRILAKKYNELTLDMNDLKMQMMQISGIQPFDKIIPKISKK